MPQPFRGFLRRDRSLVPEQVKAYYEIPNDPDSIIYPWLENKQYEFEDKVIFEDCIYQARFGSCGLRPDLNLHYWELIGRI